MEQAPTPTDPGCAPAFTRRQVFSRMFIYVASCCRKHRVLLVSLACLACIYAISAGFLAKFGAFWSPDSGARFAMIRNWQTHGSLLFMYNENALADPTGRAHPLAGYLVQTPKGLCVLYPPLFPFLCGLVYRSAGFAGLAFSPILGGLGTATITYCIALKMRLRSAVFFPLLVGLATPLGLYSVVFWDHSLQMLLTGVAAYCLLHTLETRDKRFAILGGIVLGAGLWLHEVFLALFIALALSSLPHLAQQRNRQAFYGLILGFVPALLAWLICNWWLYGVPQGPHLLGPNDITHSGRVQQIFAPEQLFHRFLLQLVSVSEQGKAKAAFSLLLLLCIVCGQARGRAWLLCLPACLLAGSLSLLLTANGVWAHGLFEATPLFLPVLAPGRAASEKSSGSIADTAGGVSPVVREVFCTWMRNACLLLALAVLLNGNDPGLEWGSRYMLVLLPLLALLAAYALERSYLHPDFSRWQRGAVLLTGMTLAALSFICQARGFAAIRTDIRASRDMALRVQSDPSPALVTDLWWLGAELSATNLPQPLFYAKNTPAGAPDLATALAFAACLRQRNLSGVSYLGSRSGLALVDSRLSQEKAPFLLCDIQPQNGFQTALFVRSTSLGARRDESIEYRNTPPVQSGQTQNKPAAAGTLPRDTPFEARIASAGAVGVSRRVLALYYPWYGTPERSGKWLHQDGVDITTRRIASHTQFPLFGPYDSTDPAVLDRHLQQAKAAGIDTLVCSWWGANDSTNAAIQALLKQSPRYGITLCVLWEQVSQNKTAQAAVNDLTYMQQTFCKQPGYLHIAGKPVIFVYSRTAQSLPPEEWAGVLNQTARQYPPGVMVIAEGIIPSNLLLWDGMYSMGQVRGMAGLTLEQCASVQHQAAEALIPLEQRLHRISIETLSPGYDDRRIHTTGANATGTTVDRQEGRLYSRLWEQTLRDAPDWVLIDSFNQWHSGSEIEPSVELGDRYLTLTQKYAAHFKALAGSKQGGKQATPGLSAPEGTPHGK